jgi:hypothetical protein
MFEFRGTPFKAGGEHKPETPLLLKTTALVPSPK